MARLIRPEVDDGYDWLGPNASNLDAYEQDAERWIDDRQEPWEELVNDEFWDAEDGAFCQEQVRLVERRYAEAKCNPRYVLNLIERGKAEPVDVLALLDKGIDPDEVWYELAPCVRTRSA